MKKQADWQVTAISLFFVVQNYNLRPAERAVM